MKNPAPWQLLSTTLLLSTLLSAYTQADGCNATDEDGDGVTAEDGDCDDTNAEIYPGAPEQCNGLDDNCDGTRDEGLPLVSVYPDQDGDGEGARRSTPQSACAPGPGEARRATDCNDADASIYPQPEDPIDGKDSNCNLQVDELSTRFDGGGQHGLAIDAESGVWSWGYNWYGQLGDGSGTDQVSPVKVAFSSSVELVEVSGGGSHSLGLDINGQVWAWGFAHNGQVGDGIDYGQLGSFGPNTPVKASLPTGVWAVRVAAGYNFSLALAEDGTAYAWGDNIYGALGDGTSSPRLTPVKVALPTGVKAQAIAGGGFHTLLLDTTGTVWGTGANSYGQLGDGSFSSRLTPVKVNLPTDRRYVAISAGNYFSLALDEQGRVWSWGFNQKGQLGDGTTSTTSPYGKSTPVQVAFSSGLKLVSVHAGWDHGYALDSSGVLWGWGVNSAGQLGDGSKTNRSTPVAVSVGTGIAPQASATGGEFSYFLDSTGTLWSHGANAYGQLGNGSKTQSSLPVKVSLLSLP